MAESMREILAYEEGRAVGLRLSGDASLANEAEAMLQRLQDKGAFEFRRTPSREDVLTITEVADRLQISKRAAERLHLPCFYLGARTRRFIWGAVLDFCARKSS